MKIIDQQSFTLNYSKVKAFKIANYFKFFMLDKKTEVAKKKAVEQAPHLVFNFETD